MIKVMFICHGNICRSPMAEFVFKDMVKKRGIEKNFSIASRAVSSEEIENPVYGLIKKRLDLAGISSEGKLARRITQDEVEEYDYLIYMDMSNYKNMQNTLDLSKNSQIKRLLEFAGQNRDVADPWFTGDAERAFVDINLGCDALLNFITKTHNLI